MLHGTKNNSQFEKSLIEIYNTEAYPSGPSILRVVRESIGSSQK